ncbi:hypothetical protein BJP22_12415 [Aeromonas veronii]|uniref:hypothetical protein n=1 Tax=Aeromonas TaxID=642 RepID=UPI0005A8735D|nr:hypothetical protein [Aeromonas veronii]OKP40203.1 hypothetical protein BJP22_12415 [Aeromonas veronii]WOE84113.1 hypothetical protein RY930_18935 [Aeromonas veronii]
MTDKVIHLAHCLYVNNEIDYEWTKEIGDEFHALSNMYAITLVQKNEFSKEALATVIVKTNLGQTQAETGKIFSAVMHSFKKLQSLPTKNVSLISTKASTLPGFIPTEVDLLKIMTDMYTQNAAGGNA